jgi:hypothetical protein
MSSRFWVVGSEFTDVSFSRLVPGNGRMDGPFEAYDEAKRTWTERTSETRSSATARFTIVREGA